MSLLRRCAVSRAHPSPAQAPQTLVTLQASRITLTHHSSTHSPRSASVLCIPGCYPFLPHLRSHLVQVYYLRYIGRQRPGHTAALVTVSLASKQARNTRAPSNPSPEPCPTSRQATLSRVRSAPCPAIAQRSLNPPKHTAQASCRQAIARRCRQDETVKRKKTFASVFIKICQKEIEFSSLNTSFWIVCLGKEAQGKQSRVHPSGSPTETVCKGLCYTKHHQAWKPAPLLGRAPYPLWKQLLLRQEASLVDVGIIIAVLERSTDIMPAPH